MEPMLIPNFRGLNLKERQGEQAHDGDAVDLADIAFPAKGRIAERDGLLNLLAAPASADIHSLGEHRTSGNVRRILVGRGTGGQAYTVAGAIQGSALTGLTDGAPWSFARIGTPAIERTYIANGIEALRAYDETSGWTTPALTGSAGVGTGKYVGVFEHRLVNARFSSTTNDRNPSSIRFSDVANPNAFTANSYVQVAPGDGEGINGCVAWRDFLFVPKETKVAVFYGTSDDVDGNPVFNFETVDTGIGAVGQGACCAGRDGFYFLSRNGIYRMTGIAEPQLISAAIDPIFEGGLPVHYTAGGNGELAHAAIDKVRMAWLDDRLYVAIPCASSSTNNRILVYDPQLDQWSVWVVPAVGLMPFRAQDRPELLVASVGSTRQVAAIRAGQRSDNGTPIAARFQTYYVAPDESGGTSVVRQVKLTGAGLIGANVNCDYLPVGTPVSFYMGPLSGVGASVERVPSVRGSRHSLKITSDNSQFTGWFADRAILYHEQVTARPVEAPGTT